MSHKNRGLRVLSLAFLAVAGLMAFMASGAQALWLEAGVAIGANKTVEVAMHTEGLLDVEALGLVIHCATVTGDDVLLVAGTNTAVGLLLYSNCKVLVNGVLSTACDKHINAKGEVEGLLEPIDADFKAKVVEASGKALLLFEPLVAGGNFAQIKFDPSCSLPETNNVKGKLLVECLKLADLGAANCLSEELYHLLKQVETVSDVLLYGTNEAKLLGIARTNLLSHNIWCGHV